MKRLWVRLSAVAGIVTMLGGGGYYLVNSGKAANEANGKKKQVSKADPAKPDAQGVVPVKDDNGGGGSPTFDGSSASIGDESGYDGGPPAQPLAANWREQPAKPMIRQVSGNEADDTTYGGGGAPVVEPAAPAYGGGSPAHTGGGDGVYDPNGNYGSDSTPGYGAPGYGAPGESAGDAGPPPPAYPATDATAASIEGTAGSGYPSAPPVVVPSIPRPDTSQPVTAPSFANGERVGSASAGPEYGAAPTAEPSAVADSPAPPSSQFDGSPSPRFDSSPTPVPASRQPLVADYPSATAAQPSTFSQSPAIAAGSAGLATATPGARALEGRQTPSISFEKIAPAEIQVGKPATFKTLVRNPGTVTARNVVVTDRPPQGTQLVDATPQPSQAPDGSLVWQIDSLAAGEEVLISMQVMPQVEGEIGSMANVTFQAQASVRTICTKPQLLVEHSTDSKVLIGEDVVFNITISNPGSGDATGIVLEEDVPPGLSHVAGNELEYEVGTLRPGESRRFPLVLKAAKAGVTTNKLRVRGDANLIAEHSAQVEVIAPKLQVAMAGPRRRYLDRPVTYQVAFGNGGTAVAKNVELTTYLPKGLQFVSTSGKGQYDSRDHAVYWSLDQLAPGQEGAVELIALPVATGEQKLQIEGTADLGLSQKYEHTTVVEAITELVFTVSDTQDPIEVGSETVYEVRIVNNGSKTATNVQVAALLPAELTPLSGEGTTRVAVQGQQVLMEPIERIGPRDEAVYKIKVKGQRAGDHIIDVRLVSDEVPTPVTKQESTKVYSDGL